MTRPELSASRILRTQRLRVLGVILLLLGFAALIAPVAGILVSRGQSAIAVGLLGAAVLPIVFWKVRSAPVVLLAFAATGIERFPDPSPDNPLAKVPLFRSFQDTLGASGAILLPIEMIFALALLAWVARAVTDRHRPSLRPTQLGVATGVLVGTAIVAEMIGLARGGVFNISLWELRPFLYLGLAYLLASQLLDRRVVMQAVLWGIVLGTGLKGVVGAERTIGNLNVYPRPESILEHDEAFFFSLFILLTMGLWVFGQKGKLRVLATALLPFVILADVGNNRRAAWVILPAMLITMAIVLYSRTTRRKLVGSLIGTLLVLGTGYVFAFHGSTSLAGSPAHAIWSQFQADPRDQSSNLYRDIENVNLGLDIRSSPPFGEGFGVPIPHPIPVFDATQIDPLINFIPHNTVLYVWLRLGFAGALAFWFVVGAAIIAGCQLARRREQWCGLLGAIVVAAVMGWVLEGWLDKGITSFRITILVGCLMGCLGAARRLAERSEESIVEVPTYGHPLRAADAEPACAGSLPAPGTGRGSRAFVASDAGILRPKARDGRLTSS